MKHWFVFSSYHMSWWNSSSSQLRRVSEAEHYIVCTVKQTVAHHWFFLLKTLAWILSTVSFMSQLSPIDKQRCWAETYCSVHDVLTSLSETPCWKRKILLNIYICFMEICEQQPSSTKYSIWGGGGSKKQNNFGSYLLHSDPLWPSGASVDLLFSVNL